MSENKHMGTKQHSCAGSPSSTSKHMHTHTHLHTHYKYNRWIIQNNHKRKNKTKEKKQKQRNKWCNESNKKQKLQTSQFETGRRTSRVQAGECTTDDTRGTTPQRRLRRRANFYITFLARSFVLRHMTVTSKEQGRRANDERRSCRSIVLEWLGQRRWGSGSDPQGTPGPAWWNEPPSRRSGRWSRLGQPGALPDADEAR